jgi:hypothetical protein
MFFLCAVLKLRKPEHIHPPDVLACPPERSSERMRQCIDKLTGRQWLQGRRANRSIL